MIVLWRDNVYPVRVFEGGSRKADLSSVTRWVVDVGGVETDSQDYPSSFIADSLDDAGGDLLLLKLGTFPLSPGLQPIRLWYFDATHPNGREADNMGRVPVRDLAPTIYAFVTLPDGNGALHALSIGLGEADSYRPEINTETPAAAATAQFFTMYDTAGDLHALSVELDDLGNPYLALDVQTPAISGLRALRFYASDGTLRTLTIQLDSLGNPFPDVR